MRLSILALSDIHERTTFLRRLREDKRVSDIDLVVVAGDITHFKHVGKAVEVLNEIYAVLGKPVLFVPGNCDSRAVLEFEGIDDRVYNIHGTIREFGGAYFFGIGGSTKTPFNTLIEFAEEELASLFARWYDKLVETRNKLIIVTHQPIKGYFDSVGGINVGSAVYREYLEKIRPVAWITGHIHEHSGVAQHGNTTILHPGPFQRGFYGVLAISEKGSYGSVHRV